MWYQCLVWSFPVAFVGKNKEQTINVLVGASKLLSLQSSCPEPFPSTWLWEGKSRSCVESMVPVCTALGRRHFPGILSKTSSVSWGAPLCKGRVLTRKGICSGIDTVSVCDSALAQARVWERKKPTEASGRRREVPYFCYFPPRRGEFSGKTGVCFCTVGSGQEPCRAGCPAVVSHSPVPSHCFIHCSLFQFLFLSPFFLDI